MWQYDFDIEGIPVFQVPHSAALPHDHHPSHSYVRTSVPCSVGCGHSLETLHDTKNCSDCHAYKIHVIYASLQDDTTLERDWTGIFPGGRSSPDYDIPLEVSQARTNLHRITRERNDAIALNIRYQNEVASLERQLREVKDRLLAIEIAYGDEPQLWNTDLLAEESRGDGVLHEEAKLDEEFETIFPSSSDSLDGDFEMDEIWTTENPLNQTATFSNASWNDSTDDFDLFQQLHLMTEEDETSWEDNSSSDAPKKPTMNSTPPVYYTDSSSDSHSPSTSSSLLSASDWAGNQSDGSSSSPTRPTSSHEELHHTLKLMASAHEEGNTTDLAKIKKLILEAERTTRHRRTEAQKYLLLNWRSPSPSGLNNSSNSSSTLPQPAPSASPPPSLSKELEMFVDASGSGIGFVFKTQWLGWTFKKTSKIPSGPDGHVVMSWAELLAVEIGLRALIQAGYRSTAITVRSDNMGVVKGLEKKTCPRKHGVDEILQNILMLCGKYEIQLKPSWISTKTNPADMPSRGVFPHYTLAFKFPPKLPARLSDLLELAVPVPA